MSCKATDGGADTHLEDEGNRTARVQVRGNSAFGQSYKLEGILNDGLASIGCATCRCKHPVPAVFKIDKMRKENVQDEIDNE